jgi:bifunctional DNA-binding transcriptional regulator/antitoxin component of YhaV-PrlF toxin-antitoxin module
MGSIAMAVLTDGTVRIPDETIRSMHLREGARLEVVETEDGILLRTEPDLARRERWSRFSFEEVLATNRERLGLSEGSAQWRELEGILSDDLLDTLEEKHRLRDEELAHEQRKFAS